MLTLKNYFSFKKNMQECITSISGQHLAVGFRQRNRILKMLSVILALFCLSSSLCGCANTLSGGVRGDHQKCDQEKNVMRYDPAKLNSEITSCMTVQFCSQESRVHLNKNLSIENVHNVSLTGINNCTVDCGGDTGIQFINMTSLSMINMRFINCAKEHTMDVQYRKNMSFNFLSGVYILNSKDLTFINVTVSQSSGTGLSVFSTSGTVTFQNCHFLFNGGENTSGGSGLELEISKHSIQDKDIKNSQYLILNSTFMGNLAHETDTPSTPFGRGGGIRLFIRDESSSNNITIQDCQFRGNTASRWGGGLFASIHGNATGNSVVVQNCVFANNRAPSGHGGASSLAYQCLESEGKCLENSFWFDSCTFENNTAQVGGATVFTSTHISNEASNQIVYHNCTWVNNSAHYGAAIALLPDTWTLLEVGVLPTPHFEDCKIDTNIIFENNISRSELQDPYRQDTMGAGVLYCMLYSVSFGGRLNINNNVGSAILGSTCKITVLEHSVVNFQNNSGYYGGGLYFIGYSTVKTESDSSLSFINNKAEVNGGAIYYMSTDIMEHTYSYSCFISRNMSIDKSSIHFLFSGNLAGLGNRHGNDIYITSLLPCMRRYNITTLREKSELFDEIANFTFLNNSGNEVATDVSKFTTEKGFVSKKVVPIIPGKYTVLSFEDLDDLSNPRHTIYMVTVSKEKNSTVKSNYHYSYITNNTIKLSGHPGDEATIKLSTVVLHKTVLYIKVKLQPCPPGYIFDNSSMSCMCSADTTKPYIGIESCNLSEFQAIRRRGFWFGYEKDRPLDDSSFRTGYCPDGFCSYHFEEMLPAKASREDLTMICMHEREGTLCSECKENYSVYFHSPSFKCGSRDLCHLGWLFYILTELFPVTIVFAIILIFNISFTSGAMNGFIFYAQVIGFFKITAHRRIHTSSRTIVFLNLVQSLYSSFNLQFFNHDNLSFCLLKEPNNLDMIAFQYTSLFFSFLLLMSILFTLKVCNIRGIKLLFKCRVYGIKSSMIHGLSAFLVLCFAQCANISLSLLSYGPIQGKSQAVVKTVVFLYGDFVWFSRDHLKYVLPALVVALILVVMPLVMLLAYPQCYKCLGLLKLQETKFTMVMCRIEKLKPFLDAFQGCFKDNCRFFSGLYFLYRVLILLNKYLNYTDYFYITLSVQLILMLLLHAIFQPYKKRRHNLIDFLLFLNMLLINAFSQHTFGISHVQRGVKLYIRNIPTIQVGLILLPLLVIIVYLGYKALRPVVAKCSKAKYKALNPDLLEYCDLPAARVIPKNENKESISISTGPKNYNTFTY